MANDVWGFVSLAARGVARQRRMDEAERKRQLRAELHEQRQMAIAQKYLDRQEKQEYVEQRTQEAEEKNMELEERLDDLQNLLDVALSADSTIAFDSLRTKQEFNPASVPQDLRAAPEPPSKQYFLEEIRLPSLLERAFGIKKRYESEVAAAMLRYEHAFSEFKQAEEIRARKLAQFEREQEKARQEHLSRIRRQNEEANRFESSYRNHEYEAVVAYNNLVLERSAYPDGFPQQCRVGYAPESRQLVVDYDLPDVGIVPVQTEFRYVKSKDAIEAKPRKPNETKELYQEVVASVALRTLFEVFEADQCDCIDVVVFNGFVHAINPATGQPVHPCILSVRTTREMFSGIDLSNVDKKACLRLLGAQVSAHPVALQAVKPVVEFDMVDKRFVEQGNVLGDLESRPNLMDLNPYEFEALVSNLFGQMGLDAKLTRTAKDGGVDAVAFDTRPIIGGKVVIQAKRYKNTVGVSAVRDLFGTMQHEGANKGILVATSSYGPDAYEFAKDKPVELIDGGGLLYLLEQIGVKAQIIMPTDGI